MTFNPNAVFISPSSISDFKSCPKLYYFRNVYRSPKTGLKIALVNPKLTLGQVVHGTLHRFLYSNLTFKTKEQLFNIFEALWKESAGEKGGFSSSLEEKEIKDRGLKMLERFFANDHFKNTSPVKLGDFPKLELGDDIILTGQLDWVEEGLDKSFHIVDFKTGENEEKSGSVQLPAYAVLASGYLKSTKLKASYWYLDKSSDLEDYELPDLEVAKENLKRFGMIIKNARLTHSFSCLSGFEACYACKDIKEIAEGKGKLVAVDYSRKQEIYILKNIVEQRQEIKQAESDLPF